MCTAEVKRSVVTKAGMSTVYCHVMHDSTMKYPGCNQCDNTIAVAISYLFIAENWLQVEGSWIAWFLTFSFRLVPITSSTLSFASFHYSLMAVSQCLTLNKSPLLPDSHGWRLLDSDCRRGGSSSLSLLSTWVAIDLRCVKYLPA